MSASVSIQTAKRENVIKIPLQAITTRKGLSDSLDMVDGVVQKVFLYDSQSKTVKVHAIETGIQDMNHIEVTKGLDTTARIVTAPYSAISKELSQGTRVTIM